MKKEEGTGEWRGRIETNRGQVVEGTSQRAASSLITKRKEGSGYMRAVGRRRRTVGKWKTVTGRGEHSERRRMRAVRRAKTGVEKEGRAVSR